MQGRFSIKKIRDSLDPIVQWGFDLRTNMSWYYHKVVKGVRRSTSGTSLLASPTRDQRDSLIMRNHHFKVGASIICTIVLLVIYLIISSLMRNMTQSSEKQLRVLLSRLDKCSAKNFDDTSKGDVQFFFKDISSMNANGYLDNSGNSNNTSSFYQLLISADKNKGINEKIVADNSDLLCYNKNNAIKTGSCIVFNDNSKYYRRYVENYKEYGKTKGHFAYSCFPSFVIAGAMKSGTGELMHWLNKHPQMLSGFGSKAPTKSPDDIEEYSREVRFFGSNRVDLSHHQFIKANQSNSNNSNNSNNKGKKIDKFCPVMDYLGHFPFMSYNKKLFNQITATSMVGDKSKSVKMSNRNMLTFDKTPYYMRDVKALDEIKALFPDMKFVVVLRDPSSRAISGFGHNCRKKKYYKMTTDSHSLILHPYPSTNTTDAAAHQINAALFPDIKKHLEIKPNGVISKEVLDHLVHNNENWSKDSNSKIKKGPKSKYINDLAGHFQLIKSPCSEIDFHNYYFGDITTSYKRVTTILSSNDPLNKQHISSDNNNNHNTHSLKDNIQIKQGSRISAENRNNDSIHNEKKLLFRQHNSNTTISSSGILHNSSLAVGHSKHLPGLKSRKFGGLLHEDPAVATTSGGIAPTSTSLASRRQLWEFSLFNKTFSLFKGKSEEVVEEIKIDPLKALQSAALKEIDIGYYDEQVQNILDRFPKEQVLILFQEDMLRDTLGALRKVENFVGINCFDFSSALDAKSIKMESNDDVMTSRYRPRKSLGISKDNQYGFKYNNTYCADRGKGGSRRQLLELFSESETRRLSLLDSLRGSSSNSHAELSEGKECVQVLDRPRSEVSSRNIPGTKYPIQRNSNTFHGRVEARMKHLWDYMRGGGGAAYSSLNEGLHSKMLPFTRALLDEVYYPHNRRLGEILKRHYGDAVRIPDSWA